MDDDGQWRVRHSGQRREVPDRVVWQILVERGVDGAGTDRSHEQGVPVRRSLCHHASPYGAARAAAAIDEDRLLETFAEQQRHWACHDVRRPTGGKGDDHPNRLRGKSLRGHAQGRPQRRPCGGEGEGDELAALHRCVHGCLLVLYGAHSAKAAAGCTPGAAGCSARAISSGPGKLNWNV